MPELLARVARAQLYFLEASSNDDAGPALWTDRDHLAYLYKLELGGRLYGSGPMDPGADGLFRELSIIAATSVEEAKQIAAEEPLQKVGRCRVAVRAYTMNEGVACYVGRAMFKRVQAQDTPFDGDISDVKLTREELLGRASNAQVHLIMLEPTSKPRPPEDTTSMAAHFAWLRENEMAGKLMNCGPVHPDKPLAPGIWGGGLGVVATSRLEAEQIAL
ncbi:MAG: hypothetical protein GEU28_14785 [Dehalococcoidia bacterium]|nr:hypothetical protein [Dehalococcoidia bacterium]